MKSLYSVSKKALSILKQGGADSALCTFGHSTVREFNVDNGKFSLYRTLFSSAASLTVIKDGKKGTVAGNSLEDGQIEKLCADCLSVADASAPDEAHTLAAEGRKESHTDGCPECDEEKLFSRCEELLADIKARFPKIHIEQMIVSHRRSESLCADLSGSEYCRLCGYYTVDLMYSAHEGEKSSSFFGGSVNVDNLDTPFIELCRTAEELGEVEKQIDTVAVEGKFVGDILMPPSSFASLLYSALGSFAGGGTILDGTSPWKDMLGKQVAAESLTVEADPQNEKVVCGSRIGGEGFVNEKSTIIKNGVLDSFIMSRYFAKKTGHKASGNTTSSYIVAGGDKSVDELVGSIKRGLWVGRISGGSPASNGDFSAVAKNSFLIEDGEIKSAVSETMINGNLREMLMNIKGISAERFCDGDTVLPCVLVGNVTVSGK